MLDAATDIMSELPKQVDFLHTVQCQCALPYRNPGDDVREWDRTQGNAVLRVEAGAALDPKTKKYVKLGLPYGKNPRLVLIHLTSEAVRTGSPTVDVEGSMTAFAKTLGLDANGRDLTRLREQLARLAAATVRLGTVDHGRTIQVNTNIISAYDLWYPTDASQKTLWPSTVRLSDDFFNSLQRHAVPLDHRAIRGIANSSLALDIYSWLAQRLHRIPVGRPQFISWAAIYNQFGQGFSRVRDFRRAFQNTLRHVHSVYPASKLELSEKGLTLYRSQPPIPSNSVAISST
jgi:hypothetical protein